MSMDGDPNGSLSMDGVLGGLEMLPLKSGTIDVFSDSAVKIEEGGLDQIFASDEEDEGQEVSVCVCVTKGRMYVKVNVHTLGGGWKN